MKATGRSIFHRLLGWFIGIGLLLGVVFGGVQFWLMREQIRQELAQAARHTVDEAVAYFDKVHAVPLESDLRILEKLSGLDEMLQAWGEHALLIRPHVEKQFLHVLSAQKGLFLSIRYFDQHGREMVAVAGNKRLRDYQDLLHYGGEDPYYLHAWQLFESLKESPAGQMVFLGPFQLPDGRWSVLAGIPKWDPEIGQFAGVILLHGDLTDYLAHVIDLRVAGNHGVRLFYQRGAELVPMDGGAVESLATLRDQVVADIRLGEHALHVGFKVVFGITPQMLRDAIYRETQYAWPLVLLLLVLVAGFAYVVSHRLAAPIILLRQGMVAIGEGRFDITLAVTTHDEIGELALAFNRMVHDLQIKTRDLERSSAEAALANQAKSLFLANMSHEIRTPMNAVIGLTDLALQAELPPKTRDHLNKISASSRALLRIINDILDFSKIDAGRLELEKVDFHPRELFDHLADLFRLQLAEKEVELILDIAAECRSLLHGDPLRLEQILMNLIGNAIKFTPAQGEIRVSVQRLQERDGPIVLQVAVQDTGIGISAEQAAHLFQPFSQADVSITRTHGGTGLGLAISKRLVELMGGRIWLESEPGRGTTFHFTVALQPAVGEDPLDLLPPRDLRHLPVLLVAANGHQRQALGAMLRLFTFVVTETASGHEALARMRQARQAGRPFRLAVIDGEPLSGDDLDAMRNGPREASECGIIVLRHPRREGGMRSREAGGGMADVCLVKPVNCSVLFDAVMELFGQEVIAAQSGDRQGGEYDEFRAHLAGARVLLVEDNAINRQVAEENLLGVGMVVDVAENGLEAIQKVTNGQYDLVLMDVQMPQMDGYAATRVIRADARFRELPILAMTAHAMEEDRRASLDAGMNGHITKPIDRRRLFVTLSRWIAPRRIVSREPEKSSGWRQGLISSGSMRVGMAPLPGLDRAALLELINGKLPLLRTLLLEFERNFATVPGRLQAMLAGRRQEDLEEARRLVHSLKGSAGNLAAMRLFEAARELESAMRADERGVWPERLARLEAELTTVLMSIGTWLREIADGGGLGEVAVDPVVLLDPEQLLSVVQALYRLLQQQDLASQQGFEALQVHLRGFEGMDRLAAAIDRLDFVLARALLRELAHKLGFELETGFVKP